MLRTTLLLLAVAPIGGAQDSFINFESPHVHPLELTPDGSKLLAVNTADNRLEVFVTGGGGLAHSFDVPVGLDPVSVRALSNDTVWVVNHVSDSVSIVDLSTGTVTWTLTTLDEPADVVFAGGRAFVSCSQANVVLVYELADLSLAPQRVAIAGEDPRAMAVSADGSEVYVAVFESGNGSTILAGGGFPFPPNVVSDPSGPYGGQNPPPNDGADFDPPQNPVNHAPPKVGQIVKLDALERWMDDNGGDWTDLVSGSDAHKSGRLPGWELLDNDVAIIDTASLSVRYVERLMNICMALAVHPVSGEITVVGTDATNEIRFEPRLQGTFLRVNFARARATDQVRLGLEDLNGHLSYAAPSVPQNERDQSLGDPRGIAWNAAGTRGYVTGMGSNNVIAIDAAGQRVGTGLPIEVGEGPTGIALRSGAQRLYVLNKFEATISVIDTASDQELARVGFFDPTPSAIRVGRKHLYDTHETSGLGHIACASCHVDGRMDRLVWDLGDPSGEVRKLADRNVAAAIPGLIAPLRVPTNTGFDFHPMKGPMQTQTLQDIIGLEPLHWRGDRDGLEDFNGAFMSLQGDDEELTSREMQEFEGFLATLHFPPNPFREFDNSLPQDLPLTGHFTSGRFGPPGQPLPNGNAETGLALFRPPTKLLSGNFACVTCHTLPTGSGADSFWNGTEFVPIPEGPNGEHHLALTADASSNRLMKVAHLRNLYEKVGFEFTQLTSTGGSGFLHDGSIDSISRFLSLPFFIVESDQEVADLVAFMLSFSGSDLPQGSPTELLEPPGPPGRDAHAAVGAQTTLVEAASAEPAQLALLADMLALAAADAVGWVVKGTQSGLVRGYYYDPVHDCFQSDRAAETLSLVEMRDAAAPANELTFTVVPKGTEVRIGVDRDEDGFFDRDEIDAGTDPADPNSHP